MAVVAKIVPGLKEGNCGWRPDAEGREFNQAVVDGIHRGKQMMNFHF